MDKIIQVNGGFERLLINSGNDASDRHSSDDEVGALVVAPDINEVSDEDSISGDDTKDDGWTENIIRRPNYYFIPSRIFKNVYGLTASEDFLRIKKNVWNLLVQEVNKYVQQKAVAEWIGTYVDEMRLFIGLCLKMG